MTVQLRIKVKSWEKMMGWEPIFIIIKKLHAYSTQVWITLSLFSCQEPLWLFWLKQIPKIKWCKLETFPTYSDNQLPHPCYMSCARKKLSDNCSLIYLITFSAFGRRSIIDILFVLLHLFFSLYLPSDTTFTIYFRCQHQRNHHGGKGTNDEYKTDFIERE